ncbi:MAG TPA: LytTR family DNA-binding domain-containing protein [Patescibacteria group bacterium]|nr:LytTR family DNA-binding domain-containing protein [Patescibacteria group bacterium]
MGRNDQENRYITITVENATLPLEVVKIVFCEAEESFTRIYLYNEERPLLAPGCLKNYETKLNVYDFIRVHDHYLVNPHHIKRFPHRSPENLITLSNGERSPYHAGRKRSRTRNG